LRKKFHIEWFGVQQIWKTQDLKSYSEERAVFGTDQTSILESQPVLDEAMDFFREQGTCDNLTNLKTFHVVRGKIRKEINNEAQSQVLPPLGFHEGPLFLSRYLSKI
jgi:hypothetical protein